MSPCFGLRLAWWCLLCGVAAGLSAQPSAELRVDFSWPAAPLERVLLDLADTARLNLSLPTQLLRGQRVRAGQLRDASLPQVLDRLLADRDLGYRFLPGGLVLYRRVPARRTLSGYVSDAASGERLIGATLYDPASGEGCVTNAFGFYSFPFRTDSDSLTVQYLGYATGRVAIRGARTLDVRLRPAAALREVVVRAGPDSLGTSGGAYDPLGQARIAALPTLGNATDPWRLLGLEAGVRTAADGLGGLHVRGGGSDQNLILLDDVPIYHPTHTFGLFSVFNAALLRSSRFYKDGFPARYEGRNASVLDVRTREGNAERLAGEVRVGSFSSSALLEGPLPGGRGGLLLAGRRSHIGYWLDGYSRRRLSGPDRSGRIAYYLYDLNAKGHYRLGRRHRLYGSYYRGGDRFDQTLAFAVRAGLSTSSDRALLTDWGNEIASLRHNWQVGDRLFVNTTLTYSDFRYRNTDRTTVAFTLFDGRRVRIQEIEAYRSRIQDYSLRSDGTFYWNARHRLSFGVHLNRRAFRPGLLSNRLLSNAPDSLFVAPPAALAAVTTLGTSELTAYAEERYTHRRWSLRAGLRLAALFHSNRRAVPFQPRLEATFRPSPQLSLAGTFSNTAQFVQLLTTSDAGLPQDLWVPVPVGFAPPEVRQVSLSAYGPWRAQWHWRLSAYHKRFVGLLRLRPELTAATGTGGIQIDITNLGRSMESGTGVATGLELTLEKRQGPLRGRLSYSYLDAERRFRGAPVVYPYDSRHAIGLQLTYAATARWQFGLTGQWQSGRSLAPDPIPLPFAPLLDRLPLEAGATRLPAYHRVDVGVRYTWGQRFGHGLRLSVHNVYDRRNAGFATVEGATLRATTALPRLPFVSYRFAW